VTETTSNFFYIATIVAFVLALRFLSSPRHARLGNQIGAVGMAIAIAVTLARDGLDVRWWMIVALVLGSAVGIVGARRVKMTQMPQMVALFNGVGGGAAALIALAEFDRLAPEPGRVSGSQTAGILVSALIGSVSFAGSLLAFGKLQELVSGQPVVYPGQKAVNALLLAAALALAVAAVSAEEIWLLVALIAIALAFGVLLVLPIGGADMPVVISFLNAGTGIAASAAGFALHVPVLIVSGMLVGASGTFLTLMMSRAMNRSLGNVLFGAFGLVPAGAAAAASGDGRSARATTADDVAVMLAYARRVVFVPGYGLAVAQAQHDLARLAELLEARGVDVKYGIHPVAGRMPGHMNVLLAEANVPYDELYEMERINPELPQTDVAVVVGANDVVNPSARSQPGSPIYGMPIIDVDKTSSVVVIKRSLSPGFAGIDNPLFYEPNTVMLFADAKKALEDLMASVKSV
jgi:NAD(P) transhydrogenase subunit beta